MSASPKIDGAQIDDGLANRKYIYDMMFTMCLQLPTPVSLAAIQTIHVRVIYLIIAYIIFYK